MADEPAMDAPTPADSGNRVRTDRRASQPRLYSVDQLLGRAPIRLRRRSDKTRLAVHVVTILVLGVLIAWWVLPRHGFSGPVLLTVAQGRGFHVGDLPVIAFLAVGARSLRVVADTARSLVR